MLKNNPDIKRDYTELKARNFQIIEAHPKLDNQQIDFLRSTIELREKIPYETPLIPGRTIYTETTKEWGDIRGLKIKGAGGLTTNDRNETCFHPPEPETSYSSRQPHIALDQDLNFRTVISTPKSLRSLRFAAAQNEFVVQTRLAVHNLSLPPLIYGRFLTDDNEAEIDCHGYETGAIAIEHDPDYKLLYTLLEFKFIDEEKGLQIIASPESQEYLQTMANEKGLDIHQLMMGYLDFINKTAHMKMEAATKAGIFRHSGDFGNYLAHSESGDCKITDTDSCILMENIDKEKQGAQLLRDMASDLFKAVSYFTYNFYCKDLDLSLYNYNPFYAYLEGSLGTYCDQNEIKAEAQHLTEMLSKYLFNRGDDLDQTLELRKNPQMIKGKRIPFFLWQANLEGLRVNLFSSLYRLLRNSSLKKGFPLADVENGEFIRRCAHYVLEDWASANYG